MKIELRPRSRDLGIFADLIKMLFVVFSIGFEAYLFYRHKHFHAIAFLGLAIFLFFLLQFNLQRPDPVVILDDSGINDRRTGFGLIRWEDIQDAHLEVNGFFLCLRVQNPEHYLERLQEPYRQKMEFHQSLGFKMLNIEVKGLDVNLLLLLEEIRKRARGPEATVRQNS